MLQLMLVHLCRGLETLVVHRAEFRIDVCPGDSCKYLMLHSVTVVLGLLTLGIHEVSRSFPRSLFLSVSVKTPPGTRHDWLSICPCQKMEPMPRHEKKHILLGDMVDAKV